MNLMNLLDCMDARQDIEIYISDIETGYLSNRQYYGTKRSLFYSKLALLEVNSIEICHYKNRDCTLKVLLFSNQW